MLSFVIGILTFVLVLICLLLILLVLVQLPKKDAGAGMAFGGGTADALFGSGSGNALTKITKFTAVAFLVLALILGFMQSKPGSDSTASAFTKMVEQKQQQTIPTTAAKTEAKPEATTPNNLLSTTIPAAMSNTPVSAKPVTPATTNSSK